MKYVHEIADGRFTVTPTAEGWRVHFVAYFGEDWHRVVQYDYDYPQGADLGARYDEHLTIGELIICRAGEGK